MTRRLLIISPHFPPVNAADHQRVRLALPFLREHGWEPWVLAVDPLDVAAPQDPLLCRTYPADIPVLRVRALPTRLTRPFGLGSLGLRCWPGMATAGRRLLQKQRFDLVFFSTTQFTVFALGPQWRRQFGVPYVLDYQDPWYNDYYARTGVRPPGGPIKYGIAQAQARWLEPEAVRHASHIFSVSPDYPQVLQRRYPSLRPADCSVLPFGGSEQDFDLLRQTPVAQTQFDRTDGQRHWVYVGRGGPDMALALQGFFTALQAARQARPQDFRNLRLHFIGTSYAPTGQAEASVYPVAQACGVSDLVQEHPTRIPYFEALQCLLDADVLIVPGSDDPAYTASKIYPYILARKPLLGIFHQQSTVVDVLNQTGAGTIVTFESGEQATTVANRIYHAWFAAGPPQTPNTRWPAFQSYTGAAMTAGLCQIFDRIVPAHLSPAQSQCP